MKPIHRALAVVAITPHSVITPRNAFPRQSSSLRGNLSAKWPAIGPTSSSGSAEAMSAEVRAVIDGPSLNLKSKSWASVRLAKASEL